MNPSNDIAVITEVQKVLLSLRESIATEQFSVYTDQDECLPEIVYGHIVAEQIAKLLSQYQTPIKAPVSSAPMRKDWMDRVPNYVIDLIKQTNTPENHLCRLQEQMRVDDRIFGHKNATTVYGQLLPTVGMFVQSIPSNPQDVEYVRSEVAEFEKLQAIRQVLLGLLAKFEEINVLFSPRSRFRYMLKHLRLVFESYQEPEEVEYE